jgi:hypothetical protein
VLAHGHDERKTGNNLYVRSLARRAHGAGNALTVGVSSRWLGRFRRESGEGVERDDVSMLVLEISGTRLRLLVPEPSSLSRLGKWGTSNRSF